MSRNEKPTNKRWRGVTVPQSMVLDVWTAEWGRESEQVVEVWRILGLLEGKDFAWDWRIRPDLWRRDRKLYHFHAGRIRNLMGTRPDMSDRWTQSKALEGGTGHRPPVLIEVHGFYWNTNDGNHRIVVAKRLEYERIRALVRKASLKPTTPKRILAWLEGVEQWAWKRRQGILSRSARPPRSPPVVHAKLPRKGRWRVLRLGRAPDPPQLPSHLPSERLG